MLMSSIGVLLGRSLLVFQPSRVLPSKSRIQPAAFSSGLSVLSPVSSPRNGPTATARIGTAAAAASRFDQDLFISHLLRQRPDGTRFRCCHHTRGVGYAEWASRYLL